MRFNVAVAFRWVYVTADLHNQQYLYSLLLLLFIIYPNVNGQSHRTNPTTWPYTILRYWYGWYWTVGIAQLSAVDLPCKVNDKSRW